MKNIFRLLIVASAVYFSNAVFASVVIQPDSSFSTAAALAGNRIDINHLTPDQQKIFEQEFVFKLNPQTQINGEDLLPPQEYVLDPRLGRSKSMRSIRVPEPNVWMLLVVGLIGLVLSRRKIKN